MTPLAGSGLQRRSDVPNMPDVAVVLPCLNEGLSIGQVVSDFRVALPGARIFVVDNGSTDDTALVAANAGATVLTETLRGKGNAVRRAFAAIVADIYVIADGDGTYDASMAPLLVACLMDEQLDMVVASRRKTTDAAFRARHEWGNRLFNNILRRLFGSSFTDVFSGYRVFSRRYVRSFPSTSSGFEIETEMTMHALLLRMPAKEMPAAYGTRVAGAASKLNTWRDGSRIAATIVKFFRIYRPLSYYGILAGMGFLAGLALFLPVYATFLNTGLVPRIPTLIVSIALGLTGLLLAAIGILLEAITASRLETRHLLYLNADRR